MRTNQVKAKLARGERSIGTWLSLCSPIAARFLARTGFDWLTVDIEHSPVDWETAADLYGVIADAGIVPLARVPAARHDYIKRVLDGGAYGFVAPMVMTGTEAQMCVAAAKLPPEGNRSVGGFLHALNFETTARDYYQSANREVLVVLQCEHIDAVDRADEIFSVQGIDAIFVGPNDLRASLVSRFGVEPSADLFEATLARILESCNKYGVAAGIHCFSTAEIEKRSEEGWRFLALGSDLSFLLAGATSSLEQLQPPAALAGKRGLAAY